MKILSLLLLFTINFYAAFAQQAIDKEKLFDMYQTQRYAEAVSYLQQSYGEDIKDIKILNQIGYCFLMGGNIASAEKYYRKAYDLQPQNLSILFSLANINSRRGNSEKAKIYYGEIVKLDSNNFNVYKLLANLYNPRDSPKYTYLLKANQINPSDGDVAGDLAEVHGMRQNYDKAYQVLDAALKADAENLILQKAILPIANQLKKYNEVIVSGEALLRDNKDATVVRDVAKAYFYTKQYEKAISLFKILEAQSMQNEGTLYFTTLCYRSLKNYNMATAYAKKTIDEAISPNTASYYSLLGLTLEENNKFELAKNAYQKGMQFQAIPNLYYRLAVLYDTKFKTASTALKYYQQYLKNKPNPESDKEEIKFSKDRIEQLLLTAK